MSKGSVAAERAPDLFSSLPAPAPRLAAVSSGVPRPGVFGRPLDLASDPSVPKPLSVIEVTEPSEGLLLEDRKLYNVLLALSWDRLGDSGFRGPFHAPAAEVRRAIGHAGVADNRRLKRSLRRLMQTVLCFPRLSREGAPGEETMPLLSRAFLPRGSGSMEWDFPDAVRPFLASPAVWARLNLSACSKFRSKYALLLYERLSLRRNLRHPVWRVTVADLRAQLGAEGRLEGWDPFWRRVLAPALGEIRAYGSFDVDLETSREPGSKRVAELRFFVRPRRASQPPVGLTLALPVAPCAAASSPR